MYKSGKPCVMRFLSTKQKIQLLNWERNFSVIGNMYIMKIELTELFLAHVHDSTVMSKYNKAPGPAPISCPW